MENNMKQLYALVTFKQFTSYPVVIQVSFNKEELEEIAEELNNFYYQLRAEVKEVTNQLILECWPEVK